MLRANVDSVHLPNLLICSKWKWAYPPRNTESKIITLWTAPATNSPPSTWTSPMCVRGTNRLPMLPFLSYIHLIKSCRWWSKNNFFASNQKWPAGFSRNADTRFYRKAVEESYGSRAPFGCRMTLLTFWLFYKVARSIADGEIFHLFNIQNVRIRL